jgi:hypothetical protein
LRQRLSLRSLDTFLRRGQTTEGGAACPGYIRAADFDGDGKVDMT